MPESNNYCREHMQMSKDITEIKALSKQTAENVREISQSLGKIEGIVISVDRKTAILETEFSNLKEKVQELKQDQKKDSETLVEIKTQNMVRNAFFQWVKDNWKTIALFLLSASSGAVTYSQIIK